MHRMRIAIILCLLAVTYGIEPMEANTIEPSLSQLISHKYGQIAGQIALAQRVVSQKDAKDLAEAFAMVLTVLNDMRNKEISGYQSYIRDTNTLRLSLKKSLRSATDDLNEWKDRLDGELLPKKAQLETNIKLTQTDVVKTKKELDELEKTALEQAKLLQRRIDNFRDLIRVLDYATDELRKARNKDEGRSTAIATLLQTDAFKANLMQFQAKLAEVDHFEESPMAHALVEIALNKKGSNIEKADTLQKIIKMMFELRAQLTEQLSAAQAESLSMQKTAQEARKRLTDLQLDYSTKLVKYQNELDDVNGLVSVAERTVKDIESVVEKWSEALQKVVDTYKKMKAQFKKKLGDLDAEIQLVKQARDTLEVNGAA